MNDERMQTIEQAKQFLGGVKDALSLWWIFHLLLHRISHPVTPASGLPVI